MGEMNFDKMMLYLINPKYVIFAKNPTDFYMKEPERGIVIDTDTLSTYVTDTDGAVVYETKISLSRFRSKRVDDQIEYIIRHLENRPMSKEEFDLKKTEYFEHTAFNADINTENECDDIIIAHVSLADILMMILKYYSD